MSNHLLRSLWFKSVSPPPVTSPPLIPEMHCFTRTGFSTSNQNYRCKILSKNTITGKVATKRNLVENVVAVQSKKDSIFKTAHKSLMFDLAFVFVFMFWEARFGTFFPFGKLVEVLFKNITAEFVKVLWCW
ncbi:unnamed protein product [Trifolium pratense]|uniref:Uncharacterized protein n=1 Tax=Trifolium pratense TaxID=57577 RepID=A0ACB0MCZ9_TRIPR|nr:unnamed protein product [Trifolium pratense]